MKIQLLSCPMNTKASNYMGLYRGTDYIDLMLSKQLERDSYISMFLNRIDEDGKLVMNSENYILSKKVYSLLLKQGWDGDIILYSDNDEPACKDTVFLGYDICGDSEYYSPLGDAMFYEFDPQFPFDRNMGNELFARYKGKINSNGLFSNKEVATSLANYCVKINREFPHAVESENNWRPFAIYRNIVSTSDQNNNRTSKAGKIISAYPVK